MSRTRAYTRKMRAKAIKRRRELLLTIPDLTPSLIILTTVYIPRIKFIVLADCAVVKITTEDIYLLFKSLEMVLVLSILCLIKALIFD
jgi:hypothetical protein